MLSQTGPLAIWKDGDALRIEQTKGAHRLWSPPSRQVDLPELSAKSLDDQ
jgi:competence protein ComEC